MTKDPVRVGEAISFSYPSATYINACSAARRSTGFFVSRYLSKLYYAFARPDVAAGGVYKNLPSSEKPSVLVKYLMSGFCIPSF